MQETRKMLFRGFGNVRKYLLGLRMFPGYRDLEKESAQHLERNCFVIRYIYY